MLMFATNETFAQKNLKLRILSINFNRTSGTDCDGEWATCFNGDTRMDVAFDIDDGATDVDETCHEGADNTAAYTWNANFNVWDRNYDFACQWPTTGNINFVIEAWERDMVAVVCVRDQCIGGGLANTLSEKICDIPINIP